MYANNGHAIYENTTTFVPLVTNCLFNQNGDGDYFDKNTSATLTGSAEVNALPSSVASGNVDGSPSFVTGTTGSWTAVGVYDSATNTTLLTDSSAPFVLDGLTWEFLNPSSAQYGITIIVSNTTSTITVMGDFSGIVSAGTESYELVDFHIQSDSSAIDAGTSTGAPTTDF